MSADDTLGDYWADVKTARQERRAKYGIPCPGCREKEPKRIPTVLLPQQRCKVCGYRDGRPRIGPTD
jgi:rRNA maturation endonuclease Nob1